MPTPQNATEAFFRQNVQSVETASSTIAYRKFGQGPPLILIHGWPFHSFTYRKLVLELQDHFTCYLIDLPGMGETVWSAQTDFTFPGQAENLKTMISRLGLTEYHVAAHNTGASIARHLALIDSERLRKLVLFNTEIPGHRPPWIPLYRNLLAIPGMKAIFPLLLRSNWFIRSGMGFGGCFEDQTLLSGDFSAHIIAPVAASARRVEGLALYLRGLNWQLIDDFAHLHANITMPVLLIWGQNDPTFPEHLGRRMSTQFPHCAGFVSIAHTKLLLFEEKPAEVGTHMRRFLAG